MRLMSYEIKKLLSAVICLVNAVSHTKTRQTPCTYTVGSPQILFWVCHFISTEIVINGLESFNLGD